MITIPTEPIGSIPRPLDLIEAVTARGDANDPALDPLYDAAVRDTIDLNNLALARFSATTRDVAFAKIRARVEGTALAAETLGGH